jgi:hypothetical protein
MATTNTDAADLVGAPVGGVIHEDVMDQLWQIDPVERPFIDAIGSETADNQYKEFTQRALRARNLANRAVDGQAITAKKGDPGKRLGAYHQILFDNVSVSERAQNVDPIARADELMFQVAQIQKEIKRDEEAIKLYPQKSQPGDGDEGNAATTGPGMMPGAPTWIQTNVNAPGDGTEPTMSDNVNKAGYPNAAPVAGTKRAMTDTMVKDLLEDIFTAGGNPSLAISHPKLIRKYSAFQFSSAAQIATLTSDQRQGANAQNGGLVAYGSVNVLVTDFGITVELVPDRQYELHDSLDGGAASADCCDLILLDTEYWANCTLQGYQTKPLAKVGLSDHRYVSADLSLLCFQEKSSGIIRDINPALAVTAS